MRVIGSGPGGVGFDGFRGREGHERQCRGEDTERGDHGRGSAGGVGLQAAHDGLRVGHEGGRHVHIGQHGTHHTAPGIQYVQHALQFRLHAGFDIGGGIRPLAQGLAQLAFRQAQGPPSGRRRMKIPPIC